MRKTLALVITALFLMVIPALAASQLTGAGSTFDYPFFSKAFYLYGQKYGVEVNYQSIGSGGGIEQFTQGTVDFGATDVPMNPSEVATAQSHGGKVLQVPVALGGESITYNIQGVGSGLRLTTSLVADIYLGKITNWNDPAIARLNPRLHLPNLSIIVVHRSDGSGTTYIFTDFLSHVSSEWKSKVGAGKSVSWPAQSAVGGKGNEGVAGAVRDNPGAIGYVELAYALQNNMTQAILRNRAGKWVNDTPGGVRAAAATKPDVSATDFSIVDSLCAACYPIAGYSWAVVYQSPQDKTRAKELEQLLTWVVGPTGQSIAGTLDYVPLPENVQALARKTLQLMRV